jgi:hypothetical protein
MIVSYVYTPDDIFVKKIYFFYECEYFILIWVRRMSTSRLRTAELTEGRGKDVINIYMSKLYISFLFYFHLRQTNIEKYAIFSHAETLVCFLKLNYFRGLFPRG